jgi:hypothetical protein
MDWEGTIDQYQQWKGECHYKHLRHLKDNELYLISNFDKFY